jgi:WD40 repeat protein
LKAAESEILDLAFSPDGSAIAATIAYQGHCLWNLEASLPSPVLMQPHTDSPYKGGLTFSSDGRSVSWMAPWGERQVYARDSKQMSRDVSFAATHRTINSTHSACGSRVISQHGLPEHCLIGWKRGDEGWLRTWTVSIADLSVECMTLSSTAESFAMLTRSTLGSRWWEGPIRVEIRDAATAAIRVRGEYPYIYAFPLLFSPDSRQLVGFNGMTLLAWNIPESGELEKPRLVRNDSRTHFTALAFHPSGHYLFATSNDTTTHVFNTHTWERIGRFTWQIGRLKAVAVSPDGTLAAVGGDGGDIVIWDVDF